MFKVVISIMLLGVLTGCSSVQPAKSKCFSSGRVTCSFTPIDQMWSTVDAASQS